MKIPIQQVFFIMTQQQPAIERHPAKRVFAEEFNDAVHSFSTDSNPQITYVLLPTGERALYVWIMGTLTERRNVGTSGEYWKARVVDSTNTPYYVCARPEYQEEEAAILQQIEVPQHVSVIGKARTYEPHGSDDTHVYVEPTHIHEVDAATRSQWTIEAAYHTYERIERPNPDPVTTPSVDNIYPTIKPEQYWEMAVQAVNNCPHPLEDDRLAAPVSTTSSPSPLVHS